MINGHNGARTGPTGTRGNTENGSGHRPAITHGRIATTARVGKDAGHCCGPTMEER